jgi:hypothetical protein
MNMQEIKTNLFFMTVVIGAMIANLVVFSADFTQDSIANTKSLSDINKKDLQKKYEEDNSSFIKIGSNLSSRSPFGIIGEANAGALELDDETLQGERPLLNVFLSGTNTDAGYVIQLKKSFIYKIEESLKYDHF